MSPVPPLQPTLWRTCRVVANHTRLRIIGLLAQQSPQTVSDVARRLHLTLPVASQSLRALEARGLLTARRVGRHTRYRLNKTQTENVYELVSALQLALRRGPAAAHSLFRLVTAFTHPRRVEIFRALQSGPGTLDEISAVTHIPFLAMRRHLRKLEARGFVIGEEETYSATIPSEAFARALARMAAR